MIDRVRRGLAHRPSSLACAIRFHHAAFTDADLGAVVTPPEGTPSGAHNYVVPVPHAAPVLAVRVSYKDDHEPCGVEFADEMEFASTAWLTGAGLEPLWFGIVAFAPDDVRTVSCWPWATRADTHARGLSADEREAFACSVVEKLRALASVCVYTDANIRNVMWDHRSSSPVIIDFERYFTSTLDRDDPEHAAATRALVPVAMLLIECSAKDGLRIFTLEHIARVANSKPDPVALVSALGEACERVCRLFGDVASALMRVIQSYAAESALRRRASARFLSRVVSDVDARAAFARILAAGQVGSHARAFMRLALSTAFAAETDFRIRLDAFSVEYARLSPHFARGIKRKALAFE
jgi:hypothetical protein